MYTRPVRRRAAIGPAGAPDRQIAADRHNGQYTDFLRRHELEAQQAAQGTQRNRKQFAECLLKRAGDPRNVMLAIEHLNEFGGHAPGPNGLRPGDLDRFDQWELARQLGAMLTDGEYKPSEPRVVAIPKGGNRGTRPIQISDLQDRVAERAILQIVRPFVEPTFLGCSFGFRYPDRGRERALATAEKLATNGRRWIWIAEDLKNAFENLPRTRLMQIVRKMIPADGICELIESVSQQARSRGIRQGGPLSPHLLNIYAHWMLDTWWQTEFPNVPLIRFADDLLIVCRPEETATVYARLEQKLRAAGIPLKHNFFTATKDLGANGSVSWLGYNIRQTEGAVTYEIADKSWDSLEEGLALAWEAPEPVLVANDAIKGWIGQQGVTYSAQTARGVDAGIAQRATFHGFEEIPSLEETTSWWYRAHLRWLGIRQEVPLGRESALADGSADQHLRNATISSRGAGKCDARDPAQQQYTPPRREVNLFCDGSCLGPHGPGGWAWLLVEPATAYRESRCGSQPDTTNNRMELTAVIRGLAALPEPAQVHLVVDSEYVSRSITEWLPRWQQNGWRSGNRRKRELKNKDLWQQLYDLLLRHQVDCRWVRGHSGHPENEFVDRLAHEAAVHQASLQQHETEELTADT